MTDNKQDIISIPFGDVYSFEAIKQSSRLQDEMNDGGVYIWGLVFPNLNHQPTGSPIDNTERFDKTSQMFIPYYVGQSEENLWNCFNQRHNNPSKNNLYTILSYDYIKEFYKDCKFPEMLGIGSNRNRKWFDDEKEYFQGKIIYYNNYQILKHLYGFSCYELAVEENYSTEYVETALRNANKISEADMFKNYRKKFFKKTFFCYAKGFEKKGFKYKDFENYIFYCLKGKTVSKHDSFRTVQQNFSSFTINPTSPLKLFKPTISQCFMGY